MPDQNMEMLFPTKGLDLNDEFEEQPPGTTAVGNNVRARDVLQQRIRGGSRPGLDKYIPAQIPEGAEVIQHLDVIVDPTEAALTQNFTSPDDTWIEISPGVWVPPGGAGWQPNPNVTQPQPPSAGIAFVQMKQVTSDGTGGGVNVWGCDLDAAPTVGNLLVLVISGSLSLDSLDPPPDFSYTVGNLIGTTYTQIATDVDHDTGDITGSTIYRRLAMWRRTVASATNDTRVEVTQTADNYGSAVMFLIEYRRVNGSSPVDGTATAFASASNGTPTATGNVTISGQTEMLLAAFAFGSGSSSTSPAATSRLDPAYDDLLRVFELKPLSNPADDPSALSNGNVIHDSYAVIAVSIKKAP